MGCTVTLTQPQSWIGFIDITSSYGYRRLSEMKIWDYLVCDQQKNERKKTESIDLAGERLIFVVGCLDSDPSVTSHILNSFLRFFAYEHLQGSGKKALAFIFCDTY